MCEASVPLNTVYSICLQSESGIDYGPRRHPLIKQSSVKALLAPPPLLARAKSKSSLLETTNVPDLAVDTGAMGMDKAASFATELSPKGNDRAATEQDPPAPARRIGSASMGLFTKQPSLRIVPVNTADMV
jgi:hypothetical protein